MNIPYWARPLVVNPGAYIEKVAWLWQWLLDFYIVHLLDEVNWWVYRITIGGVEGWGGGLDKTVSSKSTQLIYVSDD